MSYVLRASSPLNEIIKKIFESLDLIGDRYILSTWSYTPDSVKSVL